MAVYRKIAEKIVDEYDFDWTENARGREVCITSVEMFCANVLNVSLIFLIVLLLGVWSEALVFFLTFGMLRLYAGGGHARNYVQCVAIYTIVLLASIWCARAGMVLPTEWLYAVLILGMVFSIFINWKYAGRQQNIGSIQNKFRKRALIVLSFVECEVLTMGMLVACTGEGGLQYRMKGIVFLQIFALITQSLALYAGKQECITEKTGM